MKTLFQVLVVAIAFAVSPVLAHHAAEGILDEDVFAMIDSMVGDTQHAELDFEEMPDGGTVTTIETGSLRILENLIDDGLLANAAMLDGDVTVEIDFEEQGRVTLTIDQVPQ
jgi:hypothetical protein